MFILDPLFLTLIVSGGIFGVSFMLGFWHGRKEREQIAEEMILYLCEEGFLRYKDRGDEVEIMKLESDNGYNKEKKG